MTEVTEGAFSQPEDLIGKVFTIRFTEQDDESQLVYQRMKTTYGNRWKLLNVRKDELHAGGRWVFVPANGKNFTYSTPNPWSQFDFNS